MIKILIVALVTLNAFSVTNVIMKTNKGEIEIALYEKKAPKTVKNFLAYVKEGFYKNTIFHRVIDNFMIQGGGFDTNLSKKSTRAPIINEASNKVSNENGTIAMARTSDVNSATAQFFFNVKDNKFLDHRGTDSGSFGYAVFGKVVKGMTVLNQIKKVRTKKNGPFQNLPEQNVVITDIYLKK